MTFSWEQRIYRPLRRIIDNDVLDEDRVEIVKRALYFTKYRVAIHFAPSVVNWVDYRELLTSLQEVLAGLDHRLVSSDQALYFNVYTNDPKVLALLNQYSESFQFTSVHVVHKSCWLISHSKPKNKGRFYHKFQFRVRVSDAQELQNDQYQGLMSGCWLVAGKFFYCRDTRDLMMFKLLHESDIMEISERDSPT